MNLAAQGRKKGESRGRACYKKCPESSTANQTIFDCQISHQGREYRICYVSPTLPGLTSSEHLYFPSSLKNRSEKISRVPEETYGTKSPSIFAESRSEERRVGKECRSEVAPWTDKEKRE